MIKIVRTVLVVLFCLALLGAAGLYYYNYTHEDVKAPVFRSDTELLEVSVTDPEEALLEGLAAEDDFDGDVTDQIRVRSISQLINDTDVTVSYIVFDKASNYATYSRTVRYRDYVSPRWDLTQPMIFGVNQTVRFDGSVIVTDQLDGDISGRLKLEQSTVINTVPGSYSVTLSASNRMGDTIYLPLTVQIVDNSLSRPEIVLKKYLVYLDRGARPNYRRYLSTVTDPMESNQERVIPFSAVSVNHAGVDTSTPGTYEVYYYYTGISGEIATVILTVIVE